MRSEGQRKQQNRLAQRKFREEERALKAEKDELISHQQRIIEDKEMRISELEHQIRLLESRFDSSCSTALATEPSSDILEADGQFTSRTHPRSSTPDVDQIDFSLDSTNTVLDLPNTVDPVWLEDTSHSQDLMTNFGFQDDDFKNDWDSSFFPTEAGDGCSSELTTNFDFNSSLNSDYGYASTFGMQNFDSKLNDANSGFMANFAHVAAHLRLAAAYIESTA